MPIYEYVCESCDEYKEILRNTNDKSKVKCGVCGGEMLKVMSSSNFHLSGARWARDCYGLKKENNTLKSKKYLKMAWSHSIRLN